MLGVPMSHWSPRKKQSPLEYNCDQIKKQTIRMDKISSDTNKQEEQKFIGNQIERGIRTRFDRRQIKIQARNCGKKNRKNIKFWFVRMFAEKFSLFLLSK